MPSVIFHQPAGAEGLSPFPSRPATSQRKSPKLDGPPATNGIQHTREWDLERDKWDLEHGSGIWSTEEVRFIQEHGTWAGIGRVSRICSDLPRLGSSVGSCGIWAIASLWAIAFWAVFGCMLRSSRMHAGSDQIHTKQTLSEKRSRIQALRSQALRSKLSGPKRTDPSPRVHARIPPRLPVGRDPHR